MTTYGVLLPSVSGTGSPYPFADLAAAAVAAEDAGFTSLWVDQQIARALSPGQPGPPVLEAITLLGALALRTRRMRLGVLDGWVALPTPGVLAKMVTTLDIISGGRAVLGLGAGGRGVDDRTGPEDRDGPAHLGLLEDAVRVCRALFTGDDVTFAGTHVRLDHARNLPRPVQAGGPKLLVGGGEPTLGLAARYADQCLVSGDLATLVRSIGILRRRCAEVARDPREIDVVWLARLGDRVISRPEEIPDLFAGPIGAGADQVVISAPSADAATVTALGRALDLEARPA